MIRNYLKVALRSMMRNRLTDFINVAGLALSMACCILIALFIRDELSYDRYHSNADRIYRLTRNFLSPDGSVTLHLGHVAPPFGPLVKNDFSGIEEVARVRPASTVISYEEGGREMKSFNEESGYFAEPEIFRIFDIEVTEGSAEKALNEPFQIMLSEKTSRRYFGKEQALGKSLRVDNRINMVVTGVFEDFPAQSHWHPEILFSFSTLNDSTIYGRERLETNWGNNAFATYLLAKEPFDVADMEHQFPAFLDRHMGADMDDPNGVMPSSWTTLFLQRLTDIHLRSHLDSEVEANGNITTVHLMAVVGLFIILIACFNFINLSTARATKRAKEVGLRKVSGAYRTQLVGQYLGESVLISLMAMLLAIFLAHAALDWLNGFTSKEMTLNLRDDWSLLASVAAASVGVGILAGIYPAFVVSSFRPASILKGGPVTTAKGKSGLRKTLVVAQFAISITLIIATLITFRQLRYLNNRALGYTKDQILILPNYEELQNSYDAFYNELLKDPRITNASQSHLIPTGMLLDYRGDARVQLGDSMVTTDVVIKNVSVDHQFFNTYGIPFLSGRNFSRDVRSDDSISFILNETAVRMIGLTPDEILTTDFQYADVRGRVIGVVKDFHFESLHEPIVPVVFHLGGGGNISVQVSGERMPGAIQHIESIWKKFLPHRPFEYEFLSMRYIELYRSEQNQGALFIFFSGLAIFIASLGLFGLATFNTLQRVREIGIRKVFGASVTNIVKLLSREIVLLVLLANVVAWPVAWYFSSAWLEGFAYRVSDNALPYLAASVGTMIVALLTVSIQTIRAAITSPAETLRQE